MKNLLILFIGIVMTTTIGFGQPPAPGQEGILVDEITHVKKNGTLILANGETQTGIFSYNEYGERKIIFHGADGNAQSVTYDNPEEITSFELEGRGTFYPIFWGLASTKKQLAMKIGDGTGYVEYKVTQVPAGLVGMKIVGGRFQGSKYELVIYHERKDVYINESEIHKLDKTITEYVDYCPELTNKVAKKEKGYKRSLMMRDFQILRKVINEAATTCAE